VPQPLLSAAMIVRDEEANLPACLQSIAEVVDEMVIVDTGSTDATMSIARSFGARVHVHPWHENFAEARNVGLELARGAWILYIDADERLRPISRELVRARLEQATEVALRVRLRPSADATPYWEYRLWRSDPRIRFVGMMHEKVTSAIAAVSAEDRTMAGESELFLEHVGYEGDQSRKHERNLPLLRAQLAADPGNAYNWNHLGQVLKGLGDSAEFEAAVQRAVEIARESRPSAGMMGFLELIRHRQEQGQDATALIDEALTHYPDNVALAWHKACAEIEAGRYERALRRLERFDADTDMPVEDITAYPAELFGARAAEARGLCLFKLARYGEAAAAYRRAEKCEPEVKAHRLKRVLAEHRAHGGEPQPSDDGLQWAAREALAGVSVDLGGVAVGLSATDAMRATAIRSVLGRVAPSGEGPDLHLAFGAHRVPPPERVPDESQGGLQLWHDDAALSIAYGTSVGARVESGWGVLGGYFSGLTRLFHQVAPFMLASLLGPRGRFVLHAGAIQRDGCAVLVLGDSGAGKSTLVLGALRDGWSVLADDLVIVRSHPSAVVVSGIPKALHVPGEVLGTEERNRSLDQDSRGRIELPFEGWDRASHPVTAVILAGHGDRDHAWTEPIGSSELLILVMRAMLSGQKPNVRRYVRLAISLCELPAFRLLHARAPETRAAYGAEALAACLRDVRSRCSSERALPTNSSSEDRTTR